MKRFLQAIRDQMSPAVACVYLGRDRSTVYKWLQAGEAAKGGDQRDFLDAVTRARAEGLCDQAANLRRGAKKDWRAAEVVLRRRDPDSWGDAGKRSSAEHERSLQAIELRKAEAEAAISEARAKAVAGLGSGGMLLLGLRDLLDDPSASPALREELERWLVGRKVGSIEVRDLGAEPDEDGEREP